MNRKPFSISRPGMERMSLRAPTYPFSGTFMLERIVATVQLLLLSIMGAMPGRISIYRLT